MEPKISVIIPVYNGEKVIGKALQVLKESSFKEFEVIVIDDCSTDQTAKVIEQYNVRYFKLDKQGGPGIARNVGASKSRGHFLFFLDADVILSPQALGQLYETFRQSKKEIGAVIGRYSTIPANDTWLANYLALFKNFTFLDKNNFNFTFFTGAMGGIKRDLFWQVGGFTEMYGGADVEDYEFGHRISDRGYKIILNPNIVGKHHFPPLSKVLKNYYRRTKLWTQLFIKRKRFDSGAASSSRGLLSLITFAAAICLILSLPFPIFFLPFLIFLSLFLLLNSKFLIYCQKQRNSFFTIYAFGVSFIIYLTVASSAVQVLLGKFSFLRKE